MNKTISFLICIFVSIGVNAKTDLEVSEALKRVQENDKAALVANSDILADNLDAVLAKAKSNQALVDTYIKLVAEISMIDKAGTLVDFAIEIKKEAPKAFKIAMDKLSPAHKKNLEEFIKDLEASSANGDQ